MNVRVDCLKKGENPLYDKNIGVECLSAVDIDSNSTNDSRIYVPLIPVSVSSLRSIADVLEQGEQEDRKTGIIVIREQDIGVLVM